jgi:D-3-phosphoglycerate dehydrogenase
MKLLNLDHNDFPSQSIIDLKNEGFEIVNSYEFSIHSNKDLEFHLRKFQYDIIIMRLGYFLETNMLDSQSKLKYVLSATTGHNHLNEVELKARNIKLISLKGEGKFLNDIQSTSEHVWALLLNICKNITKANKILELGKWEREELKGYELNSKTLGIIGYGRLGKRVVLYGEAFNMNIKTFDIDPEKHIKSNYSTDLESLIELSDVIVLLIDFRESNRNFFNHEKFDLMKHKSIFINCSRGECVDENALLEYLKSDKMYGCGLDVLDQDSSWKKCPTENKIINYSKTRENIIITPHIGGYSDFSIEQTRSFITKKFLKQINYEKS